MGKYDKQALRAGLRGVCALLRSGVSPGVPLGILRILQVICEIS